MSWHDVLGVAPTADDVEITVAFRRLAKQVHPDTAPTADEEARRARERAMARLNQAYREARAEVAARRVAEPRSQFVRHAVPARPVAPTVEPNDPVVDVADSAEPAPGDPTLPTEPHPVAADRARRPRWGWRVAVVGVVAVLAFVVVTERSTSAPDAPTVDSCVVWAGGFHRTPCDEPHAGRVVLSVEDAADCPSGSSYTRHEGHVLCIDLSG